MKKSAFTLIELLVVISIIAILAGIALPVFSQVMERGKATQDLSNMRQIGIGSIAYLADNNDQIFTASTGATTATTSWPVTLYSKYVPNWKAFKSPFDTRPDGALTSAGTGIPVSYGINTYIFNATSASPTFDGNTTKYVSPSQLIYMAPMVDTNNATSVSFSTGAAATGDINVVVTPPAAQNSTTTGGRGTHAHRSQINALYADSHVASITYGIYSTTTGTLGSPEWQPLYTPPGQ